MSEIFRLHNISLNLEKKKLLKLNISIFRGDFLLINGKNAAGKSLLLKLLYLKIFPIDGDIYLFGKKVESNQKKRILEYRKNIGVILQNNYLIPFFSVFQNIQLASDIQNKKKNFNSRINEILEWLGLTQIKDSLVSKLSNGQKQRVVIARALINNPKIIIADQPENNLDKDTIRKIFFLFESLNKLGSTIIITSNLENKINLDYKTFNLNHSENDKLS